MSFSVLRQAVTIPLVFFSILFFIGEKKAMGLEKPDYKV